MFVTTVIAPQTLDDSRFERAGYCENVLTLLRAIESNGLILADSDKLILEELSSRAAMLGVKHRKRVTIPLEQLLQKGKRRIVCTNLRAGEVNGADGLSLCNQLRKQYHGDTVIIHEGQLPAVQSRGFCRTDYTVIDDYLDSEFERKRIDIQHLPPLDMLEEAEFRDAIVRAIRYSKKLNFYDKQIGKGDEPEGFLKGIGLLANWWGEESCWDAVSRSINIYTMADCSNQARRDPSVAVSKVRAQLVNPLRKKTGVAVTYFPKIESSKKFHARYLETDQTILLFDGGFRLLDRRSNGFARCVVHKHEESSDILAEWRALADYQ